MNKSLKGCPFCEKRDTLELTSCAELEECANFESCDDNCGWKCVVCNVNKGGCGASGGYADSAEKAIEKWNRRPEPENKPLTLEKLRERANKPVWIQGDSAKTSGWALFKSSAEKQIARCPDEWNISYYLKDYGETWLAYDHPPKED